MAFVTSTRNTSTSANAFLGRISAFAAKMRKASELRAVYRQTYNELSSLNDRELNDLGLNRSLISHTAWEAAQLAARDAHR